VRSLPLSLIVVLSLAGCQSQGGPVSPGQDNTLRPRTNQAEPLRPISQTNNETKPKWTPDWWFNQASRTSAGSVQACGTATSGTLIDARRAAIDNARDKAVSLIGQGQPERLMQSASNPNTQGGFTVWVVIELGGQ